MEPLHGFSIINGKISIAVTSNGCTHPEHFKLEFSTDGNLTVIRTVPDECKMIAHIVEFTLSTPENLGARSFKVQNPFVTVV